MAINPLASNEKYQYFSTLNMTKVNQDDWIL